MHEWNIIIDCVLIYFLAKEYIMHSLFPPVVHGPPERREFAGYAVYAVDSWRSADPSAI